jgi:transcriptional regulator with XRE-family HTH domain
MSEREAPNVGLHLRTLRNDRGLSLRALAELCELSANTISLIERGITSPSVSTLDRLARALGVPIASIFTEPGEEIRIVVTRSEERPRSASASVLLESLGTGLEHQACEPFLVTLKPGATSGNQVMVHDGQELVFCLEGAVEYEIEGERHRLNPGDALLFRSHLPHRWRNPNSKPAVFLLMIEITERIHKSVGQHLHP